MSVKLVVVALLAAAVTTVLGDDETPKLTVKTCNSGAECKCADADAAHTKEYPTTCPASAESNIYWMADNCTAEQTTDYIVKGYLKSDCNPVEKFKTCDDVSYHKATCTGEPNSITVKLITECTKNVCTAGTGGCSAEVDVTTACTQVGSKYYKLVSTACPASGGVVEFMEHMVAECGDTGKTLKVQTECGGRYRKLTCDTAGSKVTFKTCTKEACADDSCTDDTEVSFNKYTKVNGVTLFIDQCPAADATEIPFKVYADVKEYKKECTGTTERAMATCVVPTTTTTESTNETTNETTTESGVSVPAHSVGVLALVLCLLACVY